MGKRTDKLLTGAIQALKSGPGSFKTRHNHLREATRFVRTLRELGLGVQKWSNITNRHVAAVIQKWQSEGLSVATIKEYASGVRAVATHFGNDRIAPDNKAFGLGNRVIVSNRDKSVPDSAYQKVLERLIISPEGNDRRVAAQIMLQRELGLRVEESFKFAASRAVLSDGRVYVSDGTKGGRDRILQETSANAKAAIEFARTIASQGNTMPSGLTERQWSAIFYRTIKACGISRNQCGASSHGFRHRFAQEQYQQVTGFAPPCKFPTREEFRENALKVAGGTFHKLDKDARIMLKGALGHGPDRDDVVSVYLGSR
jgi:site-specific recombinase XerD